MAQTIKNPPVDCGRPGFSPWVEKIPWRRAWQPTPVFLPGEAHGQRSLEGYSPRDRKESVMTEKLSTALPLVLLLSRFRRVRLCATPQMAATRLPRPDFPDKNTGVGCHFLLQCMKGKSESEVVQSCPTLSNPVNCSPPGSSGHGILQARVLEWVASAFSEDSTTTY